MINLNDKILLLILIILILYFCNDNYEYLSSTDMNN